MCVCVCVCVYHSDILQKLIQPVNQLYLEKKWYLHITHTHPFLYFKSFLDYLQFIMQYNVNVLLKVASTWQIQVLPLGTF